MKKLLIILFLLFLLPISVNATEYTPPTVPPDAEQYMPQETNQFGEGLMYVLKAAIQDIFPEISNVSKQCGIVLIFTIILSVFNVAIDHRWHIIQLGGVLCVGITLIGSSKILIQLGLDTSATIADYSALLLPVITSALAAQGGVSTSAALYTGTIIFTTVIMKIIVKIIAPLIYAFIAVSLAGNAFGEKNILKIKDTITGIITWFLKTSLYIFTGYITITGVLSGTIDASTLKAAKLTISGTVPVIGGILADASESVLLSAGIMKNSAGIYGILAIFAICIGPFLKIAIQYCFLKFTSFLSGVIASDNFNSIIADFSTAMGFVLAMTGTVCLMQLISIGCFMKGLA